jgi:hypothetical protein
MANGDPIILGQFNSSSRETRIDFSGVTSQYAGLHVVGPDGLGIIGSSSQQPGVWGGSRAHQGVFGTSLSGNGVFGSASSGAGVYGTSDRGYAGYFNGDVRITGTLSKGGGGFRIDHPLDPDNKYLSHSFVESPDMKNIYDGVVELDEEGTAWVELPEWFEALNGSFRYHLTAVGSPAPELHVAEEVSDNRFRIAGGKKETKVCWQVTGIRKDGWAEANRVVVEEDKDEHERELLQWAEVPLPLLPEGLEDAAPQAAPRVPSPAPEHPAPPPLLPGRLEDAAPQAAPRTPLP